MEAPLGSQEASGPRTAFRGAPARDARAQAARQLLRTLVPAALAGGIMALYPAIAETVVERLGRGFEPRLVTLYVATLVGLFLLDAWSRDRKLERSQAAAAQAEAPAELEKLRADELHLVLDVARELEQHERIESALLCVLEKVRERIPFAAGCVYLKDSDSSTLVRRGVCPLTAEVPREAQRCAEDVLAGAASPDACGVHSDAARSGLHACLVRAGGDAVGAIVLLGAGDLTEPEQAQLLAVADRLGAALNGLRLLTELEGKERALRRAYRELRVSGSRLARARALEQATVVGQAADSAISGPIAAALEAVRRIARGLGQSDAASPVAANLERLKGCLIQIRECCAELKNLGRRSGRPSRQQVNDALVASLDLALPDLKRAGIEVRLSLERDLPEILMDAGVLERLLARLLRRARAALRRAPVPRRLSIETRGYGAGVSVVLRDNSAGVSSAGVEEIVQGSRREADASQFERALRRAERSLFAADAAAHGVSIDTDERIGEGRTVTVHLRGAGALEPCAETLL
ncbi:MAG: hypothetical protein HY812_05530 [Planctomycetes bacterium]|nr:hypothetical protein [Planctomycetota bacterium]